MEEHDFPGKLIVVEGADGSGTTTQSKKLAEELNAVYSAEHGARRKEDSLIGEKVEEMISQDGYSPEAIALGFAADRMVHLEEKIIPLLEEGETVVCDRYYHSSLVYQPVMGADKEWVENINRNALKPDQVFILDVSADVGMGRLEDRGGDGNIFETLNFQEEVVVRYRQLAEELDNATLIDGSGSIEEVFQEIRNAVE